MARESIAGTILPAWDVDDRELVAQRFFFKVSQARVGYVIQVAVPEHLKERLMVDCDDEVGASDDKVSGFVQTLDNGKRFPFYWSVTRFG